MSNRKLVNYIACFTAMLRAVEAEFSGNVAVRTIIIDFEYAMWQAFRAMIRDGLFEYLTIKGCTFHFCQCVFKRIQDLKLVRTYHINPACRLLMKSLMAMPLLPLYCIVSEFKCVKSECYAMAEKDKKNMRLVDLALYF